MDDTRDAHRRMCGAFDACREDGSPRGIRDAALLSVLYGAGVPTATALRLPLAAWDGGRAILAWEAPREDAGLRARKATDGARRALDDWRELRGGAPGPLLCRLEGRDETPRPLEEADVTAALERWSRRAGVGVPGDAELRRHYTSPWWEDAEEADARA